MPLWKIHHPVGAYTSEDKKLFSAAITSIYEAVPIPRFYVRQDQHRPDGPHTARPGGAPVVGASR
jgi:hypothetical protein